MAMYTGKLLQRQEPTARLRVVPLGDITRPVIRTGSGKVALLCLGLAAVVAVAYWAIPLAAGLN